MADDTNPTPADRAAFMARREQLIAEHEQAKAELEECDRRIEQMLDGHLVQNLERAKQNLERAKQELRDNDMIEQPDGTWLRPRTQK